MLQCTSTLEPAEEPIGEDLPPQSRSSSLMALEQPH